MKRGLKTPPEVSTEAMFRDVRRGRQGWVLATDAEYVADKLEGLSFRAVGLRHGVSAERARQRVCSGAPYFLAHALHLRQEVTGL